KWQGAADLHHVAMQEAIHDRSLGGLRQQRTASERCAIALRYLTKYYPEIEVRSGKRSNSEADRTAAINRLGSQTGVCPANQNQASVFGSTAPRFMPAARSPRASNEIRI